MTFYNIEAFASMFRRLPAALIDQAMPDLAKAVKEHLHETIAQQQTPFGVPWPSRIRGTRPVLVHAAENLEVSPVGRTIFMVLSGADAIHHQGRGKGSVQRQVILYKKDISKAAFKRAKGHAAKRGQKAVGMRGVPPKLLESMRDVLTEHFNEWKKLT